MPDLDEFCSTQAKANQAGRSAGETGAIRDAGHRGHISSNVKMKALTLSVVLQ